MARDLVLLVTHSGDFFTIDRVEAALKRRGAETFRLDTDRFPTEVELSAPFGYDRAGPVAWAEGRPLDPSRVCAVWCRRMWQSTLPAEMPAEHRQTCIAESATARDAWLAGLETQTPPIRWVNDPTWEWAAENKARQLNVAHAVGLSIPPTLITNRPDDVRRFFADQQGRVVAKLLRAVSFSMEGNTPFVYTNRITEADLDDLDGLHLSPMVFQALVPKALELRVAVVGTRLFCGGIDVGGSVAGATDWRRARPGEVCWQPASVPDSVARCLRALMTKLRLIYGAVDLIRMPDGEHVFLEVNPAGEWGMLERDLGLPISRALADTLLGLDASD